MDDECDDDDGVEDEARLGDVVRPPNPPTPSATPSGETPTPPTDDKANKKQTNICLAVYVAVH